MHFENLLARWRYLDRSCFMKTMRYLHLKRTTFQVHCNDLRCNPKQIYSTVHGQQLEINYSSMIISTCIICGSIRHLRTVRSWKLWHCRSRKKTAVLSSYNRGKRFHSNFPIIDSLSIECRLLSRVRKFRKDPQYFDEVHPFWPHWKEEKKWIDTVYTTSAEPKRTASIVAVRSNSASRGRCWCERMKPINIDAALV